MARQLIVELVAEAARFRRGLDESSDAAASFGDRLSAAGTKMTAFVSVPIIGFLGAATKAAVDDAAAQAHLAGVLERTTGATRGTIRAVEDQIGALMKVSTFTDDELRPAYETLVAQTGSVKEATDSLRLAMDIAAGKGIDLEKASLAVAKANEGNFAAVNKLVPGLVDLSDKTLTVDDVTKKLAATFGGAAAEATETAAGRAKNLSRDLGELTESLGAKLLPILEKVLTAVGGLVDGLLGLPEPAQNMVLIGALALAAVGPLIKLVEGLGKVRLAIIAINTEANRGILAKLGAGALAVVGGISAGNVVADKLGLPKTGEGKGSGIKPLDDAYNAVNKFLDSLNPFHSGGIVPGAPGTQVPIMALAGERVIPAGQSGGMTIVVNVGGSVTSERQLVDAIHEGLLGKQRRSGNLGIVGA